MRTSRHFNYLPKVAKMVGESGSKHDSFLAICLHKANINYINDQEGCPCFLINHFIHLDCKQFVKISHETIALSPLFPHTFITGADGNRISQQ